mmetsp:Transcript_9679/g.20979  ORF Transcript_9679/g.20979 Transcript_9679/m.20979 type:complete len:216 (-) Transcript_9679:1523-2170(-)
MFPATVDPPPLLTTTMVYPLRLSLARCPLPRAAYTPLIARAWVTTSCLLAIATAIILACNCVTASLPYLHPTPVALLPAAISARRPSATACARPTISSAKASNNLPTMPMPPRGPDAPSHPPSPSRRTPAPVAPPRRTRTAKNPTPSPPIPWERVPQKYLPRAAARGASARKLPRPTPSTRSWGWGDPPSIRKTESTTTMPRGTARGATIPAAVA